MSRHPQLRPDLVVVEQVYRGETSYVVKDPVDHRYFRFRALEVAVMQEFDGIRSPEEIAAGLQEGGLNLGPAAVEGFGRKLHQMGLMVRSLAEKSVLQLERLRANRRRRLKPASYRGSLLRMRWSVGDPDAWLERTLPRVRFMFTRPFIAASILLFLVYAGIVFTNWPELHAALATLYTPSRFSLGLVVTFYFTGIVIIAIHELGHAYACKYFGGRVHEMGAMLIYFEPAFYCNVNDAWTFPELRQRMWVTVAGSWIQMIVAAVGAIVWISTARGTLVHDVAAAAVLIGGITTVLANANPLIPLDGYYALSDWLEIPNLRQRSFGYLAWMVKRHLLRLQVPEPAASDREKRVFRWYGVLAATYITSVFLLIYGIITGWVSHLLGTLGVLLVLGTIFAMSRGALRAGGRHLLTALREHRAAWRGSRIRRWAAGVVVGLILLGFLPWPLTTGGPFRAVPARTAEIAAAEGGVVSRVLATEGVQVQAGAPVAVLRNPELERQAADERRLVDSLELLAWRARSGGAAARSRGLEAERDEARARLTGLMERLDALTLRSPVSGVMATPRLEETTGRWLAPGEVLGIVAADDSIDVRIALAQAGGSLVVPGQPVRLVSHANPFEPLAASVTSVALAADTLDGRALTARVRLPRFAGWWRPGVSGEAKITIRRSTLAGVLWWAVKSRVRKDLLL